VTRCSVRKSWRTFDTSAGSAAASTPPSVPNLPRSRGFFGGRRRNRCPVRSWRPPCARRAENQVDPSQVSGSGRGGRITKEDVLAHLSAAASQPVPAVSVAARHRRRISTAESGERIEKRVPMTRLRAKVAERLLQASQQTAMLTTFNEVNMKPIMEMRKGYGERFEKRHGIRLGFMSFFVKAAVEALKRFPAVNASIDGNDIVYHGYHDIGVAVSSDRGLVVPVVRDAERMNLAEIEKNIIDYGKKARDGKLTWKTSPAAPSPSPTAACLARCCRRRC
jgi:2-oxoglutarate dehydrogenase E2 component (dihydrolipoamide succinyltransferase)